MAESKQMIRLYALYVALSSVFAGLFGYLAVTYGGPLFAAGFMPPAIFGIAAMGKAYRLGQDSDGLA